MKTITEFSGTLLREAATTRGNAPGPKSPDSLDSPSSETTGPATEPAARAEPEAVIVQTEASDAPATQQASGSLDSPPPDSAPPDSPPLDSAPEPGAGAAANLGVSGDRLARLAEALQVVEGRLDIVRRVRVLQLSEGEATPPGAKKIGDFVYLVELMPQAEKPGRGRADRGGRQERRGGGFGGGFGGFGGRSGPGRRPGEEGREREPRSNEVPSVGAGWMLSRAPGEEGGDRRRGRGGPPRGRRPGGPGGPGGRRSGAPGGPPGSRGGAGQGSHGPPRPGAAGEAPQHLDPARRPPAADRNFAGGPGGGRGAGGRMPGGRGPGGRGPGNRGPGRNPPDRAASDRPPRGPLGDRPDRGPDANARPGGSSGSTPEIAAAPPVDPEVNSGQLSTGQVTGPPRPANAEQQPRRRRRRGPPQPTALGGPAPQPTEARDTGAPSPASVGASMTAQPRGAKQRPVDDAGDPNGNIAPQGPNDVDDDIGNR
jgi:hypothetical protein